MARGLLISFAGYPVMVSSFFPDNGLASLAGTLIAHGHEVQVLDFNIIDTLRLLVPGERSEQLANLAPAMEAGVAPETVARMFEINRLMEEDLLRVVDVLSERIAREVAAQRSHFVGFKLWSGDGFPASVRMANRLRKEFPELKIFGGGPAVLYSEQVLLQEGQCFDALVDGEGELAILGLAAYSEGNHDLSEVPNLILKADTGIRRTAQKMVEDLDELALPNYDPAIYPSLGSGGHIKVFVLDESRGCPMNCAFCVHRDASGNRWRVKSPDRLVEEIGHVMDFFGVSCFRLGGSYTPAKLFSGLIDSLKSSGKNIRFTGFAHPEGLPVDRLNELFQAGCRCLFFGIESFDADDLKKLGKRSNPEKTVKGIQACMDASIVPGLSMIAPLPGQSQAVMNRNQEIILQLSRDNPSLVMVMFPGLLPRSRWWRERDKYGFKLQVSEDAYRRLLSSYKIRHILPHAFWPELPYSLDGRTFREFTGITAQFLADLTRAGMVTNVPDELVMLAENGGCSLADLRSRHRRLFFTLNHAQMHEFVSFCNQAVAIP